MKPEVVIQMPKSKPNVDISVPPKILKCTEELLKMEIPSEDVEMKDDFCLNASKQKATDLSTPMSATTKEPTSTGVKPKSGFGLMRRTQCTYPIVEIHFPHGIYETCEDGISEY